MLGGKSKGVKRKGLRANGKAASALRSWLLALGSSLFALSPTLIYHSPTQAPVAQLDRVPDYESGGRTFESCRVHHLHCRLSIVD